MLLSAADDATYIPVGHSLLTYMVSHQLRSHFKDVIEPSPRKVGDRAIGRWVLIDASPKGSKLLNLISLVLGSVISHSPHR